MSGRIKADDIVYVREHAHIDEVVSAAGVALKNAGGGQKKGPVSYTHLTLPTKA